LIISCIQVEFKYMHLPVIFLFTPVINELQVFSVLKLAQPESGSRGKHFFNSES